MQAGLAVEEHDVAVAQVALDHVAHLRARGRRRHLIHFFLYEHVQLTGGGKDLTYAPTPKVWRAEAWLKWSACASPITATFKGRALSSAARRRRSPHLRLKRPPPRAYSRKLAPGQAATPARPPARPRRRIAASFGGPPGAWGCFPQQPPSRASLCAWLPSRATTCKSGFSSRHPLLVRSWLILPQACPCRGGAPLQTARRSASMLWSVTRSGNVSTVATFSGMPTCGAQRHPTVSACHDTALQTGHPGCLCPDFTPGRQVCVHELKTREPCTASESQAVHRCRQLPRAQRSAAASRRGGAPVCGRAAPGRRGGWGPGR